MMAVPELRMAPPFALPPQKMSTQPSVATLLVKVLLATVNVPELEMAFRPWTRVRNRKVSRAPALTVIIGPPLPLIVILGAVLGPRMARLPTIAGSTLATLIVPTTPNFMLSMPLPAAQPFVALMVLAAVIASRRTQMPGAPVSASELTVIVVARAAVLSASAKATAIAAVSTTRILAAVPRRADTDVHPSPARRLAEP